VCVCVCARVGTCVWVYVCDSTISHTYYTYIYMIIHISMAHHTDSPYRPTSSHICLSPTCRECLLYLADSRSRLCDSRIDAPQHHHDLSH
jgi:hypothetical protein